jgi:hypothetical protein
MLVPNCIFRSNGAAVLLSNKRSEARWVAGFWGGAAALVLGRGGAFWVRLGRRAAKQQDSNLCMRSPKPTRLAQHKRHAAPQTTGPNKPQTTAP